MKIVIATGIYPPDIGGPAQYAKELHDTFLVQNHQVKVIKFGKLKYLPTGIRHLCYFFKFFAAFGADYIIILDTCGIWNDYDFGLWFYF